MNCFEFHWLGFLLFFFLIYCLIFFIHPPQAQNPDELSIVENEELELMAEGDGDGWVQARNYKGEVNKEKFSVLQNMWKLQPTGESENFPWARVSVA